MALRRIVFVLASIAVGAYYLWGVRATGYPFQWGRDLGGYYDYLGRSFAQGQLYLPVQPAPELLAMPNPYDPAISDTYKLWDAALFHRRYYLYHGAGPAVMLFTPWRLLTRHDMPENFALFLFCFGGYLFACGTLAHVLSLANARTGPAMLGAMLIALGICQSVPYLLNRVWVYEIAIGSGYFCVSGAFFMLARSLGSKTKIYWLAGSGLMFGLAVSCRPTSGIAAAIAWGGLALIAVRTHDGRWAAAARESIPFTIPLVAAGAAIAFYNFARFGNPFEFGIRYLLSGPFQNRLLLRSANVLPGFYYHLFCRPEFDAVFPWVRMVFRYPFDAASHPLPKEYIVDPATGALFLSPFIAGAVFVPRARPTGVDAVRIFLWILVASSAAILLFISATGWAMQRYAVDFVPLAVLAALVNAGIWLSRSAGWRRIVLSAVLVVAIAFGAVVNLALGLSGPYDDVLKNRPASYARLARWFSPAPELRPIMNPRLDVKFSAVFDRQADGTREPLLTIGRAPYSQFVYAERHGNSERIVLKSQHSDATYEMPAPDAKPVDIDVMYTSGKLTVAIGGREGLAADAGIVFTAPSQVTVGENRIDPATTKARFTGQIQVAKKIVEADGGL